MRAHVNELKSSTFRVHHGGKTIGTAFSVKGSEYLLTASHVVSNPAGISYPGISVVDAIGKEHPIEIAGNDKGSDIAILKSSAFPRSNGLALGNYAEVEEGDEVLLCGFPFGTEYHVTHRGMVSAKSIINGRQSLQVDASVNKGNSGGPCVAVIDGELKVVGIICTRVVAADLSTFRREHKNIIDSHPGMAEGLAKRVSNLIIVVFNVFRPVLEDLDRFMNAGIGEAVAIDYAKSWLQANA